MVDVPSLSRLGASGNPGTVQTPVMGEGGVLRIVGRVLRTGASPVGRVDETVDNASALPTASPTLSRLSPTSSTGPTTSGSEKRNRSFSVLRRRSPATGTIVPRDQITVPAHLIPASAVLKELEADGKDRFYRHVVIDEGQDFSPEMLRSLAAAVPKDGSLTFFGDVVQQIYGHRISWCNAGLTPRRIWQFNENYRNTKQISQLALALAAMPSFPDDPDLVEPTAPVADGPRPVLARLPSELEERQSVVSRAIGLARTGTVAILFRTREQEAEVRPNLTSKPTNKHSSTRQT